MILSLLAAGSSVSNQALETGSPKTAVQVYRELAALKRSLIAIIYTSLLPVPGRIE